MILRAWRSSCADSRFVTILDGKRRRLPALIDLGKSLGHNMAGFVLRWLEAAESNRLTTVAEPAAWSTAAEAWLGHGPGHSSRPGQIAKIDKIGTFH
jgi:hypothetical protein